MMNKMLCFIGMVLLLAACGGKAPKIVEPPRPNHVVLEIEASGNINPNPEGRPSPLTLRIYELKSLANFHNADFISLYRADESVLGATLVRKQEVVVQPNEKKTIEMDVSDDTQAIGVFAAFRSYEQARWKTSAAVLSHGATVVPLVIEGTRIDIPCCSRR